MQIVALIVFRRTALPTSSLLRKTTRERFESSGVRDVMPIQVWTNNCRASLDIVVFNGADPKQISQQPPLTLTAGSGMNCESTRRSDHRLQRSPASTLKSWRSVYDWRTVRSGCRRVQIFCGFEENLIYTSLATCNSLRTRRGAGQVTQHEGTAH